jgi:hypothetical protein
LRLGLNLRGDLAKLTDDELAGCLQNELDRRERLAAHLGKSLNIWLYQQGFGMPFGRGLLHARIFYKVMGFFYGGSLSGKSLGDLYVLDCEIKDIRDELQRRVSVRGAKTSSPP